MLWTITGLVLRSSLLLLFALLSRRFFPRVSPANRHRVLLTSFILLLLWPVLPLVVPQIFLPLKFASPAQGLVTVQEILLSRPADSQSYNFFPLLPAIWLVGVCLSVAPLVAGYLQVWHLRRKSAELLDENWHSLSLIVARQFNWRSAPRVLVAPVEVMPQTFGVFQPVVLLPPACLTWSEERRRAVLTHEFAHVKRHDTFWQLMGYVAAAAWWFQPLCWIARRSLRTESELACDEAVLASGMPASLYATELLAIARSFGASRQPITGTVLMAGSASLESRLKSVLESPSLPRTKRQAFVAFMAICVLGAGCSSISVAKDGHLISEGGVSMRRTLFASLLTSASLSAAAIGGSISDPTGAAVTDARASLYNPDTKAHQETVSVADGKFAFDHLAAGQYILRVEKPGFAPVLREFKRRAKTPAWTVA